MQALYYYTTSHNNYYDNYQKTAISLYYQGFTSFLLNYLLLFKASLLRYHNMLWCAIANKLLLALQRRLFKHRIESRKNPLAALQLRTRARLSFFEYCSNFVSQYLMPISLYRELRRKAVEVPLRALRMP